MHYALPILTVHSYLWHIGMIILSFRLIRGSYVDPKKLSYKAIAALFLLFAGIAEMLNFFLHPFGPINLFYICPYFLMRQVFFSPITNLLGNAAGIAAYLSAVLIGGFVIHKSAGIFAKTEM